MVIGSLSREPENRASDYLRPVWRTPLTPNAGVRDNNGTEKAIEGAGSPGFTGNAYRHSAGIRVFLEGMVAMTHRTR
ncbi:hypothetical protein Amsp01_005230 [Amycolatopsis sp. NBRC 101858]|nr:hypothetical protein Amsp01_005230 [Amycolatopsis sp. NBRC 101858]